MTMQHIISPYIFRITVMMKMFSAALRPKVLDFFGLKFEQTQTSPGQKNLSGHKTVEIRDFKWLVIKLLLTIQKMSMLSWLSR